MALSWPKALIPFTVRPCTGPTSGAIGPGARLSAGARKPTPPYASFVLMAPGARYATVKYSDTITYAPHEGGNGLAYASAPSLRLPLPGACWTANNVPP